MGIKIIEADIEDSEGQNFRFIFNTMKATKAFKLQAKLVRYLLPAIGTLSSSLKSIMQASKAAKADGTSVMEQDIDIDFTGMIHSLATGMTDDQFLKIVQELTHNIKCRTPGSEIMVEISLEKHFDEVFNSEFGMLYKLLGRVLEANFSSLFGKSGIGKAWESLTNTAQVETPEA